MSPSERLQTSSSKWDWRIGGPARGGGGGAAAAAGGRMRVGGRASSLSPMRGAALTASASRATPSPPTLSSITNSAPTTPAIPTVTSSTIYDPNHRISSPSRRRDIESYSRERVARGRTPRKGKNPSDHGFCTRKSTLNTTCPISRRNSQTDRGSLSYMGWMLGAQEKPRKDACLTRRNASPGVARALDWRPEVPWVESRRLSKGRSWTRRIPGFNERCRTKSVPHYQHRPKKMKSTEASQISPPCHSYGEMENILTKEDGRQQMKRHGSECVLTATYYPSSGYLDDFKFFPRKKSKQALLAEKRKLTKSSSEIQLSAAKINAVCENYFDELMKNRKDKHIKHMIPKLEMFVKKEKRGNNKSSERSLRKDTQKNAKTKPRRRRDLSSSGVYRKSKLKHDFKMMKKKLSGSFDKLCNLVMYHSPTASLIFPQMSSLTLEELKACISASSMGSGRHNFIDGRDSPHQKYNPKQMLELKENDDLDTSHSRLKAIAPIKPKISELYSKSEVPLCTVQFSDRERDELVINMHDKRLRHSSETVSNASSENEDESDEDKTIVSSNLIPSDTTIPSCEGVFEMTADNMLNSSRSDSLDIAVSVKTARLPNLHEPQLTMHDTPNICIHTISVENIQREMEGVKISVMLEGTVNANLSMQQQVTAIPEASARFGKEHTQIFCMKEEDTEICKSKHSQGMGEISQLQIDELYPKAEKSPSEKEPRKSESAKSKILALGNSMECDRNLNEPIVSCNEQHNNNKSTDEIVNIALVIQTIQSESNAQENISCDKRDKPILTERTDKVEIQDRDKNESNEILKKSQNCSREKTVSTKTPSPQATFDSEASTWTSISSLSYASTERREREHKRKGKRPVSRSVSEGGGDKVVEVYTMRSVHSNRESKNGETDDKANTKRISSSPSRKSKSEVRNVTTTPNNKKQSKEIIESLRTLVKNNSISCRSTSLNLDEISEKPGSKHSREPEKKGEGSCVICDIYLSPICGSNKLKEKIETKDIETQNPSVKSDVDNQNTHTNLSMISIPTDTMKDTVADTNSEMKTSVCQTGSKVPHKSQTTSLHSQTSKNLCSSNTTNFDTSIEVEKQGLVIPKKLTCKHFKEFRPLRWYSFSNIGKTEEKNSELGYSVPFKLLKRKIKPIITSPDHSISEKQTKNRVGASVFHTKPKGNLKPTFPNKRLLFENACQNKVHINSTNNLKNEKIKYPRFLHLEKNTYRVPVSLKSVRSRSKLKSPPATTRSTSTVHTQTDWIIPPSREVAETKVAPKKERLCLCSKCMGQMCKNGLQQMESSDDLYHNHYSKWLDAKANRLRHTSTNLQSMFKCEKEQPSTFQRRATEKTNKDVKRTAERGMQGRTSPTRHVISQPHVPLRSTRSIHSRTSRGFSSFEGDDCSQRTPNKVRFADGSNKTRIKFNPFASSQSIIQEEDVSIRSQVLSKTFGKQHSQKDGHAPLRLRDAGPTPLPPSDISVKLFPANAESVENISSKHVPEYTIHVSPNISPMGAEKEDFGEGRDGLNKMGPLQKYSRALGSHLHHILKNNSDGNKPFKSIVCVPRGDAMSDGIRKPPSFQYAKKPVDVEPKPASDVFNAINFPIWHL